MHVTRETVLQQAHIHAQSGRFPEMLAACQQIKDACGDSPNALLSIGVLLLDFGYLTRARDCFERVRVVAPNDLRPPAFDLWVVASKSAMTDEAIGEWGGKVLRG